MLPENFFGRNTLVCLWALSLFRISQKRHGRTGHGVQQKNKCLSSSETMWLYFQHVVYLTAGIAPRNGVESPAHSASKVRQIPPCQWSETLSRGGGGETDIV